MAFALSACTRDEELHRTVDDDIQRRGEALVTVVQCFVDNGVIPERELSARSWLVDGRIHPDASFTTWGLFEVKRG